MYKCAWLTIHDMCLATDLCNNLQWMPNNCRKLICLKQIDEFCKEKRKNVLYSSSTGGANVADFLGHDEYYVHVGTVDIWTTLDI